MAIDNPNRTLKDFPFGNADINQIEIYIPGISALPIGVYSAVVAPLPFFVNKVVTYSQKKKIKNKLFIECQRLYGAISALFNQTNQSRERLEYLNFMKYVLECSIQRLQ